MPEDWDNKICEFEYAKNGMTGLETSYAVINHLLPEMPLDRLVNLFSLNCRKLFQIPLNTLNEGAPAELTLFTKNENTLLSKENLKTKSHNTPFLGRELNGKIIGIIHKGKLILNQNESYEN